MASAVAGGGAGRARGTGGSDLPSSGGDRAGGGGPRAHVAPRLLRALGDDKCDACPLGQIEACAAVLGPIATVVALLAS